MTFTFKLFDSASTRELYRSPEELEHAGYLAEITQTNVGQPVYEWALLHPTNDDPL